jgi:tetratricopeptide (TPR) repeat protein
VHAHEQAEKYLLEAGELTGQRRFNAAFRKFESAIRLHYANARAHAQFGSALLENGRYPEAVEQFRIATQFSPSDPLDVEQIRLALNRDIRQQQDIRQFQEVVDKADKASLFHDWARILATLPYKDQAVEHFKKALMKDPEVDLDFLALSGALKECETTEQQVKSIQEEVDRHKSARLWNTWGATLSELGRHAAAIEQFEKAASTGSDWATPYLNLGRVHRMLGDHEEAVNAFRKGLSYDEHSVSAYWLLGTGLLELEEYEQVVANYQLAATKAPSHWYFAPWLDALRQLPASDSYIAEYQQALNKNDVSSLKDENPYSGWSQYLLDIGRDLESAVQSAQSMVVRGGFADVTRLQEIITGMPNDDAGWAKIQKVFDDAAKPDRYVAWARVLVRIGNEERALQQLSKTLAIQSAKGHWDLTPLARLVSEFKSPESRRRAQNEIERALVDADNGATQTQWANILAEILQDKNAALRWYRKVLLSTPSDSLVFGLTRLLANPPDQTSIVNEIQTLVEESEMATVSFHWGQVLAHLEKYPAAIEEFDKTIRLQNDFADAHLNLARLYERQGRYRKASRQFQKVLELRPDDSAAIFDWGTTLLKSGQRQQAVEKYLQAVKTAPDVMELLATLDGGLLWDDALVATFQQSVDEMRSDEVYNRWGAHLTRISRYQQAIRQFQQAVDLNPDDSSIYANWRKALAKGGISTEVIEEYKQALAKGRNNAEAYFDLAYMLFSLNWTEHAAETCQAALEKDPKSIDARALLIDCLVNTNDINRAREQAQLLLADDPSNGSAYNCLAWGAFLDGKYDESIRQCELGLENPTSSTPHYLYVRWAKALHKSGRPDLALKKLQEAMKLNPNEINTKYEYAFLLMELNRNDEASAAFRKVVELQPDHAYANHNLAAICTGQGQYEEAWKRWMNAITVYQKLEPAVVRAIDKEQFVDSNEAYYHASVLQSIQHKSEEAETVLKEGLAFDPYNPDILRALAELNWERKEEIDPGSADQARKAECFWRGTEYFHRAEKLLQERSQRYSNFFYLISLGDLYLAREDHDKARKYFEEACLKDDSVDLPFARLGVINLRERQPDKAIASLQKALKLNPDDLEVKSSLAEAYLRAEKLNEAETTYRQVLNITSNHVQSLIGLGELCIALGDKKDSDRYAEAITHLTRALDVSADEKIRSKYLKNPEKAGVYYQLGYARVQSYETVGSRRDTKLLQNALKDFGKCLEHNPSHQKAIRAAEKIEKRLGIFSRDRLTETDGPRAIFAMSIIIFAAVQAAFYIVPFLNRPSLKVTDKSLQAVAKQVPAEVLPGLETLKNKKFDSQESLSNAIQPLVKSDQVEAVKAAVLQNADTVKPIEDFPEMAAGYYALLTFGSLLFMVVGLYLPQILKLKVAGIELEKSSVDQAATGEQAATGGTLGISKL